jgi:UrcA family protein
MKTTRICDHRVRLVLISAAITFLGLAGTGSPARAAEPLRIDVSSADLNIQSPTGVRSLYGRLRSAAQTVCAPFDDGRHSPSNFRFQACYQTALDSAVAKFQEPALTAMHEAARKAARG